MATMKLPPGTYLIGDPCYAFDLDPVWDGFLQAYWGDAADPPGARVFEYLGQQCFVAPTGGDGAFRDQYGRIFGVDAGMIGAVPIEFAKPLTRDATPYQIKRRACLHMLTIDKPIAVRASKRRITIGPVTIRL